MNNKPIFETELSKELGKARVYQDECGLWVTVGYGWMAVKAQPDEHGNPQFMWVVSTPLSCDDPSRPSVQHPENKVK